MDRELLLWCCILLSESGYKTVSAKEPCSQICLQTLFYVCCPLGRICFSVVLSQTPCYWKMMVEGQAQRATNHKELFIVIMAVRFNGLIFKMLLMQLYWPNRFFLIPDINIQTFWVCQIVVHDLICRNTVRQPVYPLKCNTGNILRRTVEKGTSGWAWITK